MNESTNSDRAFDRIEQEARIARTARMLNENAGLQPNQRTDIVARFKRFIGEHNYTQAAVGRELDLSSTAMSDIVRLRGASSGHPLCGWSLTTTLSD